MFKQRDLWTAPLLKSCQHTHLQRMHADLSACHTIILQDVDAGKVSQIHVSVVTRLLIPTS